MACIDIYVKKRKGQRGKTEKTTMAVEMGKKPTWTVERVVFMKKDSPAQRS